MSTVTEVIPLEGVDLGSSPPCQVVLWHGGRECGSPSSCRIISTCTTCKDRRPAFCCAMHHDQIITFGGECEACGPGSVRPITGYL